MMHAVADADGSARRNDETQLPRLGSAVGF